MKIKSLTLGELATNCYIIADEATNAACVIDPADDADRIFNVIKENGFKPEKIVLTHCHFDHFSGAKELKELCGDIPVIIPSADSVLAKNDYYNLSVPMMRKSMLLEYDMTVSDGNVISFGSLSMKTRSTPGHTPGSCCYYFENEGVLISGDTLFFGSVGRTDFPLSDGRALNKSIVEKLFVLPEDTRVFTGHGIPTDIGFEKTNNPYVFL